MSFQQAVQTWRELRGEVTAQSLTDEQRHALVHEIMKAVRGAIDSGLITYEQFERMVSK